MVVTVVTVVSPKIIDGNVVFVVEVVSVDIASVAVAIVVGVTVSNTSVRDKKQLVN